MSQITAEEIKELKENVKLLEERVKKLEKRRKEKDKTEVPYLNYSKRRDSCAQS